MADQRDDEPTNGVEPAGSIGVPWDAGSFGRQPDSILSLLPAGVYACDAQGRITYFNRHAAELWGEAPRLNDDATRFCGGYRVYTNDGRALPPHERPMAIALREGRRLQDIEMTIERRDGTRFLASICINPIRDAEQRILGAIHVFHDTNERRIAATTLAETQKVAIESEARFQLLANTIPQLAWMARPDGWIFWYNDRWHEYCGSTPEQMEGWGWQQVHDPQELPRIVEQWKTSLGLGEPWEDTFPLRRHDGEFRWHLSRAMPFRDATGEIVLWFGTNTDISEQLRHRRELKASEERFRAVVETTPECVKIVSADGALLYMNSAGLCMVESTNIDAVLGKPVIDLISSEHRSEWLGYHQRVCQGERLNWQFEIVGLHGTRRWMETHAVPLTMPDGSRAQLAVTRDITARKKTEELELVRSQELELANQRLSEEIAARQVGDLAQRKLAAIIESSDDAIVSKNLDGVISSWNRGAEHLFGYSAEEAVGQNILLVVPPERHHEEVAILARLQRGERIDHFETQRVCKDGSRVDISLSVSPIRDAHGVVVGAAKIARNISEKKRFELEREKLLGAEREAREKAQRVNALKDEFLATLSHELRTPLNAIMGWAQLLLLGKLSADELAEAGRVIERNARTQKQLIDDLLDMSRIVAGKFRLDLQRILPTTFIESALETIRSSADAKGVRIETLLDPLAGPIVGDPARLQQVVWNLLTNAVKFTPAGGKIQILLERINSHLELTVADTGQGIDPAFLPHLFERFRQADASTNRRHGGLGLGLSIVRQIVELHGGSVKAMSEGLDQGASFVIKLPILVLNAVDDHDRVHPRASAASEVDLDWNDLSTLKVMVVDDEVDSRELVRRLLTECGADVSAADSAASALELLSENIPDVLVSDIGMPDVDGYEFLRLVRQTSHAARVPAIALTAFARTEDRTRALRAGYIAHVAKPVDPSELVATIAAVAGRTGGHL